MTTMQKTPEALGGKTFYYVPVANQGNEWVLRYTTPTGGLHIQVAVQYFSILGKLVIIGAKEYESPTGEMPADAPTSLDEMLIRENTVPGNLGKLSPELEASITKAIRKVAPQIDVSLHYLADCLIRD